MKRVSLKDIAAKLGVSTSAVSFVLNGREKEMRIGAKLAARIRKAAHQAGYTPHKVAVSLRTGKSKIVALIVDDISGNFFASLARTIEKEIERHGYRVFYCSTGNQLAKGEELIRLLLQYQVDGFLITPVPGMESLIDSLLQQKRPVVLVDSYFPGTKAPYVLVDNRLGISAAMKNLVSGGYRKIALVMNDVKLVQMQERLRGYKESLSAAKIRFRKDLILTTAYGEPDQVLVRNISAFLKSQQPQAVLFAANYLGVHGLESIHQLQWEIPHDIAVSCFDDHELFQLYKPAITAIEQPVEEIGTTAVQLLMHEMGVESIHGKKQITLPPVLRERDSV
jgi:LacI family transcriptional regulator